MLTISTNYRRPTNRSMHCPAGNDSWCGYNKATAENESYDHKYILHCDVMLQIMSIYQALTNQELLKKMFTRSYPEPKTKASIMSFGLKSHKGLSYDSTV